VEDEPVGLEALLDLVELVDRRLPREEQRERPVQRELNRVGEERLAKRRIVEPAPLDDQFAAATPCANGRPAGQVDGRLLIPTA
jgi:hypothetical protein